MPETLRTFPARGPIRILFDFRDPARAAAFSPIDDRVMGGHSQSRFEPHGDVAVFRGTVLLEDGGFASVRSRFEPLGLAGSEGLLLQVRGDGKRYRVGVRTDPRFDGVAYLARFQTVPGAWMTVALPWSAFAPSWHGRPIHSAEPLLPGRAGSLGLSVADHQPGPFRLEVALIGGYAGPVDEVCVAHGAAASP